MELIVVLAVAAFLVRRPVVSVMRGLVWLGVAGAVALMLLSVATGTPVPTSFLVVTLAFLVTMRWTGARRAARRLA